MIFKSVNLIKTSDHPSVVTCILNRIHLPKNKHKLEKRKFDFLHIFLHLWFLLGSYCFLKDERTHLLNCQVSCGLKEENICQILKLTCHKKRKEERDASCVLKMVRKKGQIHFVKFFCVKTVSQNIINKPYVLCKIS